MSKIEQLISEIEMYIDECKPQPFSGNKKVVVDKSIIEDMLVELRMQTPEEVKKYQKIISNKDAILADAEKRASSIIEDAGRQAEILISESVITKQAEAGASEIINNANLQAQSILQTATNDADQIRQGAIKYTDSELSMLENLLNNALSNTEAKYNGFMKQLTDCLEVVAANRMQLNGNTNEKSSDGIDIAL